jgi:hypothetical protein
MSREKSDVLLDEGVSSRLGNRVSDIARVVDKIEEKHRQQQRQTGDTPASNVKTLSVDYDQSKPETYRGVVLRNGDSHELKRWYGKGFNQDWVDAINDCEKDKSLQPFTLDSSVHSYNQDVARRTR